MNNLWKYIIIAVGFVLAAIVVAAAYTEGHKPAQGTISVTGLGETEFTSDLIVINGHISAEDYDAAVAYSKLKENRTKMIELLTSKGVKADNISFKMPSTDKLYNSRYENGEYVGQVFAGYTISQLYTIESSDVDVTESAARELPSLIAEGIVDGERLFCAGASSGGGCTMRFMMQFPDRFKAAVPCCAMDPIVPIHKAEQRYDGQFEDDLVKAFQDKVYKWNGEDMVLEDMDTKAFCNLPMFFVHAESDKTCKVISSHAYFNARQRLGAQSDKMEIYDDEYMLTFGIPTMLSHFSWVPLLNDYSEGKAMDWLVKQM